MSNLQLKVRHNQERGTNKTDWLQSWHSFSFGEYHDRQFMGFGPLRVINEDIVAPGTGFHTHGHANMEIITLVLSGALEHKDSLGSGDIIRPGDVQVMSAGKGILHSEFNPSPDTPVHLLQIWILPQETGTRPGYQQKTFDPADFDNRFGLVVSPDGADGSLTIRQDARIWKGNFDSGAKTAVELKPDRKYWLQVATGGLTLESQSLTAGDGLGIDGGSGTLYITAAANNAGAKTEIVLFDLPQ